jgi:hypothetical protein
MRDSQFGICDVERYSLKYYEWSVETGRELLADIRLKQM